MNTALLLPILALIPSLALAQGCDVSIRSQSASVPVIDSHTCYQFEGMPADSLDWSCSNESKEMLASTQKRVQQCAEGYHATCTAKLTQEALANPRSTSKDENEKSISIPDDARVVTRYYGTENLPQARIDCEHGGGRWETR